MASYTQVLTDGTNTYLYGRERIGEQGEEMWTYHLNDALGSLRQITGAEADVLYAQSYEPYGKVYESSGTGASNYGFSGELTDPSELVYLRARYYQPSSGRFISRDTWGGNVYNPQSLNRWSYASANPVMFVDPSGRSFILEHEEEVDRERTGYYGPSPDPVTPPVPEEDIDNSIDDVDEGNKKYTFEDYLKAGYLTYLGLQERSEITGNSIFGEFAAEAFFYFGSCLMGEDFAQVPMKNAEILFGNNSTFSERLTAAYDVYFSTGIYSTNYFLLSFPGFIPDAGNSPYYSDDIFTLVDDFSDDGVDALLEGGGRIATNNNYRKIYLEEFPDLPQGWQVHHTLPQKYEAIMETAGINIHEVENLRGVDPRIHQNITREWARWEKALDYSPSADEVIDFAKIIELKYENYWFTKK